MKINHLTTTNQTQSAKQKNDQMMTTLKFGENQKRKSMKKRKKELNKKNQSIN